MMFPFTWPFSRNVPESWSVPSSDTPWSKKPVHSSLALTLPAPLLPPDHFHAMASPDAGKDEPPIYSPAPFSQSAPPRLVPNRKSPRLTVSRVPPLHCHGACTERSRGERNAAQSRNLSSSCDVIPSARRRAVFASSGLVGEDQRPARSSPGTSLIQIRVSTRLAICK